MNKRMFARLFCTFLMALFVSFTLTGAVLAADTIKLGIAGAHSGDLASYGLPSVKAAELVVKDINAKGGIKGHPVKVEFYDDAGKPDQAVQACRSPLIAAHTLWWRFASSAPFWSCP